MKHALALMILLGLPGVAAASSFVPPQGCVGHLTAQTRDCRVSHYYRCAQDAAGEQWRADLDASGAYFLSRTDYEGRWLESIDLSRQSRQVLGANAADPASFSTLLASGEDHYDFTLEGDEGVTRVVGFDRLTGNTRVIDGVALQETTFEYQELDADGQVLRRARGLEYVHPEWRLYLAGPSQWEGGDGEWLSYDMSPLAFMMPGERGFMSKNPIFECDAVLSRQDLGEAKVLPVSH